MEVDSKFGVACVKHYTVHVVSAAEAKDSPWTKISLLTFERDE